MVWIALGYALPLAFGIALSPVTVITGIVLLRAQRGRAKTAIFALCWFLAILVIAGIAYNLVGGAESTAPVQTRSGVDIFGLAIAVVFLAFAVISWQRRRSTRDRDRVRGLLRRLDNISMLGSAGLGLVQGFVRLKNITLAVGAGALMGEAGLTGVGAAGPLAVFALASSAGVLVPLIVAIIGGPRASDVLARTREWLEANTSSITTVGLVVVGLYFLGGGLAILD